MNDRYHGKRFRSFLLVLLVLCLGLIFGPAESFGAFSIAVGLAYTAYAAGQSATDFVKAKNGQ